MPQNSDTFPVAKHLSADGDCVLLFPGLASDVFGEDFCFCLGDSAVLVRIAWFNCVIERTVGAADNVFVVFENDGDSNLLVSSFFVP